MPKKLSHSGRKRSSHSDKGSFPKRQFRSPSRVASPTALTMSFTSPPRAQGAKREKCTPSGSANLAGESNPSRMESDKWLLGLRRRSLRNSIASGSVKSTDLTSPVVLPPPLREKCGVYQGRDASTMSVGGSIMSLPSDGLLAGETKGAQPDEGLASSFHCRNDANAVGHFFSSPRESPEYSAMSLDATGMWDASGKPRGGEGPRKLSSSYVCSRVFSDSHSSGFMNHALQPILASELSDSGGWRYVSPPSAQRTFFFPEDNLEFSSNFDSGNLIQMERVAAFRYNAYTAMDCANSPGQTNNRQWFHFSLRGGCRGTVISMCFIGIMNCKMYTFDWMPVAAVRPSARPQYQRLPGKAAVTSLENMPPTPGYPGLVYKKREEPEDDEAALDPEIMGSRGLVGDDGEPLLNPYTSNPTGGKKTGKKRKPKDLAMNLAFDFRLDSDIPLKSNYPLGHPQCPAMYIASNYPYSYETLQRNLVAWEAGVTQRQRPFAGSWRSSGPTPSPPSSMSTNHPSHMPLTPNPSLIFFHRETLCRTLDGNQVDLLTITDRTGMGQEDELMPFICSTRGIPFSSFHGLTKRPPQFPEKPIVVLTARVHPGESPGSHMMHGCIDFLLHPTDMRAAALRQKFVFLIVPMINPDGVVRGHSRADSCGTDLNRMYRNPSFIQHPAPYCIKTMLEQLASSKRLALFIDMHAHANKKGTFFYGNSMSASQQLQALLYAKLVSLNTPYFEFPSCNFTESNMFAVGKAGKGKDGSSRVVLYLDTGFPLSFTIEASHVAGKLFSPIAAIPGFAEETQDIQGANALMRYSPLTYADTGRGLLLALLDLKVCNPLSRLPQTMFHSLRGLTLWIQRQLQIEVAESLFIQAYKAGVKGDLSDPNTVISVVMGSLSDGDVPEKITLRDSRSLPPLTLNGLREFFSLHAATTILAQTPPSGPPRSLLCNMIQRRLGNGMPVVFAVPKSVVENLHS